MNKIFKSCDIDLTEKNANSGVVTTTTTTTITTNGGGGLSLSQATAAASALLLPSMPQHQTSLTPTQTVVVRSRKSTTNAEHSTHLSVVNTNEQQPNYFCKYTYLYLCL